MHTATSPNDYLQQYIRCGHQQMQKFANLFSAQWSFGNEASYRLDKCSGTLTFCFASGTRIAAPYQVIGHYDRSTSEYRWGWTSETDDHTLTVAHCLRRHGRRLGISQLENPILHCRQDRPWDFTAAAVHLSRAMCGYELQHSTDHFSYLVFTCPTLLEQ